MTSQLEPRPVVGGREAVAAGAIVAGIFAAALALGARWGVVLGPMPWFFPAYGATLFFSEALTAVLLFSRSNSERDRTTGMLGAAYVFSAPLIAANVLTIPNAILPAGTFGAQTSTWLWSVWHLGWAVAVALYAWSEGRSQHPQRAVLIASGAAAIVIAVALVADRILPPQLGPGGRFLLPLYAIGGLAIVAGIVAIAGLLRRRPDSLELWVAVAVAALVAEIALTLAAHVRFSIASYVGRSLGVVSGMVVMLALARDYGRTLNTLARERAQSTALADGEVQFRHLAEAVPTIVWTATADGSIDWYNRRWYEFTGQTAEEAAGWGWQAVHHPEDFPEVMRRWPDAIANGEPFEMEFRLRAADGTFRWFLTRISPYRNERGDVVRWFGANTDIEDRKVVEQRTLRVARTLQEVFLPDRLPQRDGVSFDALYVAAESDALVGGDWYDAFSLPDGRIGISIGDIAGHGLNAAVDAGRLRQAVFAEALDGADPSAILRKVDRILRHQSTMIATAMVAMFDLTTGDLTYASAGHPAPIVATADTPPRILPGGGSPLGTGFIGDGLTTTTHVVTIPGDAVVAFYTDGVTEFERDVLGGEERLLNALARVGRRELGEFAAAVLQDVTQGAAPSDDVALLLMCVGRVPSEASGATLRKVWRFHSSHAHSARASRRELMAFIRTHTEPGDDPFTSELILGELLANTVEHAPGMVEISIDWTAERPTVRIRDTGPGLNGFDPRLPIDLLDENGRGLFLVATLAENVTVRPAPGFGTEMSVVLPVRRLAS